MEPSKEQYTRNGKIIKEVLKMHYPAIWNEFYNLEDTPENSFQKKLDSISGIDFMKYNKFEKSITTFATRVTKTDSRKFTIRYSKSSGNDTEYIKRLREIKNDTLYPIYTLQINVNNNRIIGYAITKTKELFKYAEENLNKLTVHEVPNATFLSIPWDKIPNTEIIIL